MACRPSAVTWPTQGSHLWSCGPVPFLPQQTHLTCPNPQPSPSRYIISSSSPIPLLHPFSSLRNWALLFSDSVLDVARKQEVVWSDPFKHMDYRHCHYLTGLHFEDYRLETKKDWWGEKLLGRCLILLQQIKNLLRLLWLFPFTSGVPLLLKQRGRTVLTWYRSINHNNTWGLGLFENKHGFRVMW